MEEKRQKAINIISSLIAHGTVSAEDGALLIECLTTQCNCGCHKNEIYLNKFEPAKVPAWEVTCSTDNIVK